MKLRRRPHVDVGQHRSPGMTESRRQHADTVYQSLSIRSFRPIAPGDAPNRRRHSASLMTSTSVMPGPSSSGPEQPAELRPHAEHVEVRRAREQHLDALGLVHLGQVGVDRPHAGDGFEDAAPIAVVDQLRLRESQVGGTETGEVGRDPHEAIRVRVRQRPHDDGVDDGEDRAVGADAERQRGDRDRRKAGRAHQPAPREAQSWRRLSIMRGAQAQTAGHDEPSAIPRYSGPVSRRTADRCSASGTRLCECEQPVDRSRNRLGTFLRAIPSKHLMARALDFGRRPA